MDLMKVMAIHIANINRKLDLLAIRPLEQITSHQQAFCNCGPVIDKLSMLPTILTEILQKVKTSNIDESTFNYTNHDSSDIVILQKTLGLSASSPIKKEANTQGMYSISTDESLQLKEIVPTNSDCTNERPALKPKPLSKRQKKRARKARKQTYAKAVNDNLYKIFSVFHKPHTQGSGPSGNQKALNQVKATRVGAVNGSGLLPAAASPKSVVHKMSQSTVQFQSNLHALEMRVMELLDQAPRKRRATEETHMSSEKSSNQPVALIPRKDPPGSITAGLPRPKDVPQAAASASTLSGRNKKQPAPQVSSCQATASHTAATQFTATFPDTTEGIMSSLKLHPRKGSCTQAGATQVIEISPDTMSEQLAFSKTDLQAIKITFSNNQHSLLVIFNVYAHPWKNRKVLLFDELLNKVEEIRCANPAWDILVTGDFNANLIHTPEPDEQLAAENAIWSVPLQKSPAQKRLDTRGKQLVEALEHMSMRVLNGRINDDVLPNFTHHSAVHDNNRLYSRVSSLASSC
ncbi:hypothetical protein NDU88_000501 [Pleurodeles waltl]|uniref:Endonuclease/exonuclease/phosphatase domain-containing protein n=1 Tax=Pleurodeles waltl TaxID=8319 RepID=A0AAV7S6A8_PLEWA|nr:hypothetical protein NDU88_000501 [Pleurodeles waltl]